MSDPQARDGRPPVVTPTRVIAGLCLLIPFVAMLWVGSYARLTPEFIGIPFFYWYQMLWVFISSVLTFTAYLLVRREERVRRATTAGGASA
jgi:membrane protein implicated in regulation of membrane protease activity